MLGPLAGSAIARLAVTSGLLITLVHAPSSGKEPAAPVRQLTARALAGPFTAASRSCENPDDPWCIHDFEHFAPALRRPIGLVTAMGAIVRRRLDQYWFAIDSARGRFFVTTPIGRAGPGRDLGYVRHQQLGRVDLVRWSSGAGTIDPPDSSYVACAHQFIVCSLQAPAPSCSEVVTVARSKHCDPDRTPELPDEAPEARLLPDGSQFEISGKRYSLAKLDPSTPRPGEKPRDRGVQIGDHIVGDERNLHKGEWKWEFSVAPSYFAARKRAQFSEVCARAP